MNFSDTDDGPFWLTVEERLATKHGRFVECTTLMRKIKTEVLIELRSKGIDTTKKVLSNRFDNNVQ